MFPFFYQSNIHGKINWFVNSLNLYICRSECGMLNKRYGEDDLESFSGVLNIVTTGWQNLPALSLREAAKLCNPKK